MPTAKQSDPIGSRPYSRLKESPPSVTSIIDLVGKPGLSWGAAKETALFAVHHRDEWEHLEPAEAVNRLRTHHRGVWDSSKNMGSVIHAVNEAWIAGETANVRDLCAKVGRWQGEELEEQIALAKRHLAGLATFWTDWRPSGMRSEEVVRWPEKYIGTRDLFGFLADPTTGAVERWLLDMKTTHHQDRDKGVYIREWALQLAAYRFAPEVVSYRRDTRGKIVVAEVEANEVADRCGIIHLRGDGGYDLIEVDADETWLTAFGALAELHPLLSKEPKPVYAGTSREAAA